MEHPLQEILSILWKNIRLVPRPDFEGETWMVKPGCLEKAAQEIVEKYRLQG